MKIASFVRLLLPLLTLTGLVACNMPTATPVATLPPTAAVSAATETPTAAPGGPIVTGACANPLFPVVNGATWTYSGNNGPSGPYSYTDTVTEVRPDGFTLTSLFDSTASHAAQWACQPDGLVAMQLPGGIATLAMQQMHAQFETSNIQGVTFPASVAPGDTWSYSLTINGTIETSGITAQTTGDAVYNFTAGNTESVTVPAGTFDAMKVDGVLTLNATASVSGFSLPIKITFNTTSWFAPGVGMVKTLTAGDIIGTPINDTLELQSYNIP